MKIDGIDLVEGSEVINLAVARGTSFPASPDEGELFYLTSGTVGLYVYKTSGWTLIMDPASVAITGGTINGTSIGQTTPAAGSFTTISSAYGVYLGYGAANGVASYLALGLDRVGNGYAVIDMFSSATDVTNGYGLRMQRYGGINPNTFIAHKGTGNLTIGCDDAAPINFNTSNTTRMQISSVGDITLYSGMSSNFVALTDGPTVTPDLTKSNAFTWAVGGSRTLAYQSGTLGGRYYIDATIDTTGGYTLTLGPGYNLVSGTFDGTANVVNRIWLVTRLGFGCDVYIEQVA